MGQLTKAISDRDKGKLPSASQFNPRESVMAITLMNKKEFEKLSVREKPSKDKSQECVVEEPKNDMEAKEENMKNKSSFPTK